MATPLHPFAIPSDDVVSNLRLVCGWGSAVTQQGEVRASDRGSGPSRICQKANRSCQASRRERRPWERKRVSEGSRRRPGPPQEKPWRCCANTTSRPRHYCFELVCRNTDLRGRRMKAMASPASVGYRTVQVLEYAAEEIKVRRWRPSAIRPAERCSPDDKPQRPRLARARAGPVGIRWQRVTQLMRRKTE